MRRANNAAVVENAAGELYAIDLGADFCAEHEWGNKEMRQAMCIPEDQKCDGLDYHTAKAPAGDKLITFVSKGNHFIIYNSIPSYYLRDKERVAEYKKDISNGKRSELALLTWKGDKNPPILATAWDGGEFGIIISKDAPVKLIEFGKKLAKAIETGDFAVWFGGTGGNPFARSGLVVAITSLVPQEIKDYMVEAYADQRRLEKADKDTGVKKLLEKKGKKYFACSPRWADDTKTSVKYWLNPMGQQNNESGWYSPQELMDWANGVAGNKIDKVKK